MQNNSSKFKIVPKGYQSFRLFSLHFELNEGFGLIEIIIVTAVVTVALFAFLQAEVLSIKLLRSEKENLEATLLAQESLEAVRLLRDESWTNHITTLANGTRYYPFVENNKWKLTATSPGLINNKYDRYVLFEEVRRDAQDKIAISGSVDAGTRKATAYVEFGGKTKTITAYLTNFVSLLGGATEAIAVSFEGVTTDADLANFPSNNSGNGDPAQGFTTLASAINVTKVDLYLRRTTASPSNVYAELRTSPTGSVLGTSNTINSFTILSTTQSWVEFRFTPSVSLATSTKYYIRLRSTPASTDAGSGSQGIIHWGYLQSGGSPYGGHENEARRYIGRLSNPNDAGQDLDQYDYGF